MTSENTTFQHASSFDLKTSVDGKIDNIGWHLVPRPDDPNGEGSLPSVQPETFMVQLQVMSSKAETGRPSEEFVKG